jgi:phospholipase/carboxylesterase
MSLLYTAHVPAGAGPFPAVIALHGWGANAYDLFLVLGPNLQALGDVIVLCPEGPFAFEAGQDFVGHGWFPLRSTQALDEGEFRKAAEALRAWLDAVCARYPVERRKLVLAGFSQGGLMAYDLALREPARFAGLAALSSWFPAPLAASIPKLPEHETLPVLVQHGATDPMIDVEKARESRAALTRLGVQLTYREYEGMGHEVRPESMRDLLVWLDEKVMNPVKLAL